MKKSELVSALRSYVERQQGRARGQNTLAAYFAQYFDKLDIPADTRFDHWEIDNRIAQLLVAAIEEFRTSQAIPIRGIREIYEMEVGHPMPDLTDITGDGLEQALTVQMLGFLFTDVTGQEWVSSQIDQVFNAQRYLLMQRVYVFVAKVYTKGLAKFIDDTQERGMSGEFGETTVRTYYIAGRQMITFARPNAVEGYEEHSLSLLCEEGDPLAMGIGSQSIFTDFDTALAMIDDVIINWPDDLEQAWMMVAPDDNVRIG